MTAEPAAILDPYLPIFAVLWRKRLFRQGELGHLILRALRKADRPLATHEIVDHVVAASGHKEGARKAMTGWVRGNLAYRSIVVRSCAGRSTYWKTCSE